MLVGYGHGLTIEGDIGYVRPGCSAANPGLS
jgi:hypothetical protein